MPAVLCILVLVFGPNGHQTVRKFYGFINRVLSFASRKMPFENPSQSCGAEIKRIDADGGRAEITVPGGGVYIVKAGGMAAKLGM